MIHAVLRWRVVSILACYPPARSLTRVRNSTLARTLGARPHAHASPTLACSSSPACSSTPARSSTLARTGIYCSS